MARPRVRNRILAAARTLLDEQGAGALTTRAVAEAAGVTEASVFNNFGDKSGLVQALIQEALPEYEALVRYIDSAPVEALEDWMAELYSLATRYLIAVFPLTAPHLSGLRPPVDADSAEGYYTPRRALERRFGALQQAGIIAVSSPPQTLALLVMGAAMHTASTQLTLGQSDFDAATTGREIGRALGFYGDSLS